MAFVRVSSCFFLTNNTLQKASGRVVRVTNDATGVESFGIVVWMGGQVVANVGTFANIPSAMDDASRYGLRLIETERAATATRYNGDGFLHPGDLAHFPPLPELSAELNELKKGATVETPEVEITLPRRVLVRSFAFCVAGGFILGYAWRFVFHG